MNPESVRFNPLFKEARPHLQRVFGSSRGKQKTTTTSKMMDVSSSNMMDVSSSNMMDVSSSNMVNVLASNMMDVSSSSSSSLSVCSAQEFPEAFRQTNDNDTIHELVRQGQQLSTLHANLCKSSRHGNRRARLRNMTKLKQIRENIRRERAKIKKIGTFKESDIPELPEPEDALLRFRKCQHCNCRLLKNVRDSRYSCSGCGQQTSYSTSGTNSSYTDVTDTRRHVYEREKNFKNTMNRYLKGRLEKMNICFVVGLVGEQLKRKHMWRNKINPADVKSILEQSEQLRPYVKYYDIIVRILKGDAIPQFTQDQVDILCKLYNLIQGPYNNLRDRIRDEQDGQLRAKCPQTNFFHQSWSGHKLCQVLEWGVYTFFTLNNDKIITQQRDNAWKELMFAVDFPFYTSF